ncbi:MAG: class I SAM-dependent methyltransferase [Solirubrobacterales bacterium]
MTAASDRTVAWHEVECGSYAADLPLWEELADGAGGPILELGCGTGRVALHLARLGHEVVGLDVDAGLVAELDSRAADADLAARAVVADAASFQLEERFSLAIAPMQLAQILRGECERAAMLAQVAAHLRPGGTFAAALVDAGTLPESAAAGDGNGAAPLPDVRELDGWLFSSLPLALRRDDRCLTIERLRQAVSPDGELSEEVDITELAPFSPAELEADAQAAGLRATGRREIPDTDWHVGSTVCLLRRAT